MDTKITIYSVRVKTFETLVQAIINLSLRTSNKQVNTWEEEIGLGIFGRICTISFSLLKLIPESETYKKNHTLDLWDYSSICILTRTLLDSYLIYYHYCIDIPADVYERTFKHQFWNYYIDYKKIKMLDLIRARYSDLQRKTLLKFLQNINVHSKFRESMRSQKKDGLHYSRDSVIFWQNSIRTILTYCKNSRELKRIKEVNHKEFNEIKCNQFYQQQKDSIKSKIEKCEVFLLPSNNKIAVKSGFGYAVYKSTYEYLSKYVHSDSYCLDQLVVFKAGSEDAYHLIGTTLDYLIIILSFSIRDFIKIHPEQTIEYSNFVNNVIRMSEKSAKAF